MESLVESLKKLSYAELHGLVQRAKIDYPQGMVDNLAEEEPSAYEALCVLVGELRRRQAEMESQNNIPDNQIDVQPIRPISRMLVSPAVKKTWIPQEQYPAFKVYLKSTTTLTDIISKGWHYRCRSFNWAAFGNLMRYWTIGFLMGKPEIQKMDTFVQMQADQKTLAKVVEIQHIQRKLRKKYPLPQIDWYSFPFEKRQEIRHQYDQIKYQLEQDIFSESCRRHFMGRKVKPAHKIIDNTRSSSFIQGREFMHSFLTGEHYVKPTTDCGYNQDRIDIIEDKIFRMAQQLKHRYHITGNIR